MLLVVLGMIINVFLVVAVVVIAVVVLFAVGEATARGSASHDLPSVLLVLIFFRSYRLVFAKHFGHIRARGGQNRVAGVFAEYITCLQKECTVNTLHVLYIMILECICICVEVAMANCKRV